MQALVIDPLLWAAYEELSVLVSIIHAYVQRITYSRTCNKVKVILCCFCILLFIGMRIVELLSLILLKLHNFQ